VTVNATFEVHHVGAQRDVTAGDLSPHLDLATLRALPHLYGIGPLDRLTGEVTILDSKPSIAQVADFAIQTSTHLAGGVPFFVWSQVSRWGEHAVPPSATDLAGIQPFIARTATDAGIDADRAFPFLLIGTPEWIDFHVWESPGHGAEPARVSFQLDHRPMHLIGFYSEVHRGIFIPAGSFVHIHLRTDDDTASGHLDDARWGSGMTLLLPAT
jgi:hypothetical protein